MKNTEIFARAAVAAPHRAAAETGRAILAEGGDAIEAMVAMAATIAVVYPHMNGLGGDAFWMIREPSGRAHYIEAAGFAGAGATIAAYRAQGHEFIPTRGPLAALTTPAAVAGWALALDHARSRGARLPLSVLLADAIRHAAEGCAVSRSEPRHVLSDLPALAAAPGFAAAFLVDGKVPAEGTLRKNPALAATLEQMARAGLDDFHRGDVARELAADLARIGAPVTRADLAATGAKRREPLRLALDDAALLNCPPPTQGLSALLILGIFERLGVGRADSFGQAHGIVEATKRAVAIRDRVCVDFAHAPDVSVYLTPQAIAREAAAIDMRRAAAVVMQPADGGTIWMGAIDAKGLAVSYIQSIYWEYGSGCFLPATGVLMQNRGMAFALDPASPNALAPGKRPFHTLTAAMAEFADGRVMPYGAMGGDAQPQFQAQVFTRVRLGDDLATALARPRWLQGRTWGAAAPTLRLEHDFDPDLEAALARVGHRVERYAENYADMFGHAGAVMRLASGGVAAAHDPRSDGGAAGL